MSTREFCVRVGGLSSKSLFHEAWRQTPLRVDSPADMAAIFGPLPPLPDEPPPATDN